MEDLVLENFSYSKEEERKEFSSWLYDTNRKYYETYLRQISELENRIRDLEEEEGADEGKEKLQDAHEREVGKKTRKVMKCKDSLPSKLNILDARLIVLEHLVPNSKELLIRSEESLSWWPFFNCHKCSRIPGGICVCKEYLDFKARPWTPIVNYMVAYPEEGGILIEFLPFRQIHVWRSLVKCSAWLGSQYQPFMMWLIEHSPVVGWMWDYEIIAVIVAAASDFAPCTLSDDCEKCANSVSYQIVSSLIQSEHNLRYDAAALSFAAYRGSHCMLKLLWNHLDTSFGPQEKNKLRDYITRFGMYGGHGSLVQWRLNSRCFQPVICAALGGHLHLTLQLLDDASHVLMNVSPVLM